MADRTNDEMKELTMKFAVIEIYDGAATKTILDEASTIAFLQSNEHWKKAADHFYRKAVFSPGCYMEFPNGWIFCVFDE